MRREVRMMGAGVGALMGLVLIAAGADVATASILYEWINPSGGAANVNTNWLPTGIPGATDGAYFDEPAYYTVTWPAGRDSLASLLLTAGTVNLSMAGSLGIGGSFGISPGTILAVTGGTLLSSYNDALHSTNSGALTIDGTTSVFDLNVGGEYFYEGGPSANANLAIVNGGIFRAHNDLALGNDIGDHCYLGIEHKAGKFSPYPQLITTDAHSIDMGTYGTFNADLYDGGLVWSGGNMSFGYRHGGVANVTVGTIAGSFYSGILSGGQTWIGANSLVGADAGTAQILIGNGYGTFEGHCWLGDPDDSLSSGAATPQGLLRAGTGSHLLFANGLTMSPYRTGEFDLVDGNTQVIGGTSDIRQHAPFAIDGPGTHPQLWLENGSITNIWPNDMGGPALGVARAGYADLRVAGSGTQLFVHGKTIMGDSLGGYASAAIDSGGSAQFIGPLSLGGTGFALLTLLGPGSSASVSDSLNIFGGATFSYLFADSSATMTVSGPTTVSGPSGAALYALFGAHLTLAGLTEGPGPCNMETGENGGRMDISGHYDLIAPGHTIVDSGGVLAYSGTVPLHIGANGALLVVDTNSKLQSAAEIDVRGQLTLSTGYGDLAFTASRLRPAALTRRPTPARTQIPVSPPTGLVQCPLTRVLDNGVVNGLGTIAGRFHVDSGTGNVLVASDFGLAAGRTVLGDSTRTDGFVSIGQTTIAEGESLMVLDADGGDLGKVTMQDAVLQLPRTGHLKPGFRLDGAGRIEGALDVQDSAWVAFAGTVTGDVALAGTLDIAAGPPPPTIDAPNATQTIHQLTIGSLHMAPTGTATLQIGSVDQDQLIVTGAATLGGTLDVRTINGQLPSIGNQFTILAATSVVGTFSNVTINGRPGAGVVFAVYSGSTVKVVVVGAITGVDDGPAATPPPTTLRFCGFGAPRDAGLVLDLPGVTSVRVTLFDVSGRQLARLEDGTLAAGRHRWALGPLVNASGIVFARAEIGDGATVRVLRTRVVVLR